MELECFCEFLLYVPGVAFLGAVVVGEERQEVCGTTLLVKDDGARVLL